MIKNRCSKKSNTCLHSVPSSCTDYEGGLNSKSELDTCDTNIEETTEELYKQLEELYEELDTEDLGDTCIIYDNLKVKTVLKALEKEICELKKEVLDLKNFSPCDIKVNTVECPLDLSGIEDVCGERIVNLNQVLEYLLDVDTNPGSETP